jgi:4-hydroxymandelate oxidase
MNLPFDTVARQRLGEPLYRYLIGRPADLEPESPDANEAAFTRYRLLPRVMRGQLEIDIRTTLFGRCFTGPIAVGAFAGDRLFHPDGLLAVARACRRLGLPMIASEEAATALADLTSTHEACWLQIRAAGPVDRALALIDQAVECHAQAMVLTVLAPVSPHSRHGPGGFNVGEEIARRGWCTIGSRTLGVEQLPDRPVWSWEDVRKVVEHAAAAHMPVVAKGILHGEDARLAEDAGCHAIMVSNIGLRQLGRWVTPLDAIAAVREHTEVPLLLDGGVRHGVDVIITRCVGASLAVATRPVVSALVGNGEAGVYDLLRGWLDDAAVTMGWLGASSPGELGLDYVRVSRLGS